MEDELPDEEPDDEEIEQIVAAEAKRALETDAGSIFSVREVMNTLRSVIASSSPWQRRRLQQYHENSVISRRKFLSLLGFGMAGAAISASGGYVLGKKVIDADGNTLTGYAAKKQQNDIAFNTVQTLNISENTDITGNINSALGGGTLVEIPPGTYQVNGTIRSGAKKTGIIGGGESRSDVVLQVPEGTNTEHNVNFNGRQSIMKNVTWDQREDTNTGVNLNMIGPDQMVTSNVEVIGYKPPENGTTVLKPGCTSRGGVNVIERFVSIYGGIIGSYPGRGKTSYMGAEHRGETQYNNCHFEQSGQHTMYARTCGCTRIHGGLYRNNDNSNLRFDSNHPDKNSYAKEVTLILDTENPKKKVFSSYDSVRGVKLDSRKGGKADIVFENCDFILQSAVGGASHRLIHVESQSPGATFKNCRFTNDTDAPTIIAESFNRGKIKYRGCAQRTDDTTVVFENCHFTGEGSTLLNNSGRDLVFRDCCFNMPNTNAPNGIPTEGNTEESGCDVAENNADFDADVSAGIGSGNGESSDNPC